MKTKRSTREIIQVSDFIDAAPNVITSLVKRQLDGGESCGSDCGNCGCSGGSSNNCRNGDASDN